MRSLITTLAAVCTLAPAVGAATIENGPWVAHVETNLAVLAWDTDVASSSVVHFGTSPTYGSTVTGADATVSLSGWANHAVVISGLQPDTRYYYQVVSDNASSPAGDGTYWFHTAVEGGTPYRFVSMADSRGLSSSAELNNGLPANFSAILVKVLNLNPFPRFVIFSGDEIYGDSDPNILRQEWDIWKRATARLHRNIPIYITPGNHEAYHAGAEDMFRDVWEQPHNGGLTPLNNIPWNLDELAYSFDYGVVHFVSYDTNIDQDPLTYNAPAVQTAWMATDLARALPMHRIVFGHTEGANPCIFGFGASLEETSQANYLNFYTAMAQGGVGAYVCGHIHNWVGDQGIMGVKEIMNGTCGSISSTTFCGVVADHYVVWDVDCGTIQGRVYDQDNNPVTDRGGVFSITAVNTTPPAVALQSPTAGSTVCGTAQLEAAASAYNCEQIDRVEFFVDGGLVGVATGSPWQIQWDSASVADGSHDIFARAVDTTGASGISADSPTISVTVDNSQPCAGYPENILTGPGPGSTNANTASVFNAGGALRSNWSAYGTGKWGTSVVAADIEGDGLGEAVTGPGPGDVFGPHVRAFRADGTALLKVNYYAYGTLKYGVNPASEEVDGDMFAEILTGPGPGAVFGPHVRGWDFDGAMLSPLARINFFAYQTLRWGVNVAAGSVDGDAFAEILTGAGPGNVFGAQARGFDYDGGPISAIGKINAFLFQTGSYGVVVEAARTDADGFHELVAAKGPGVGFDSQVKGFDYDGVALNPIGGVDFLAYASVTMGARVGAGDLDNDGYEEIVTGPGPEPAAAARVKGFDVDGGVAAPLSSTDFDAYPTLGYGVRVATIDGQYP